MKEYTRRDINGKYFILEIFECPKETILLAAQLGSEHVTIENFKHFGRQGVTFEFEIQFKGLTLTPALQAFEVDFSITKTEFLQFFDVWDQQGCYALFHDKAPLKFKASNLPENQRYRTLENFGWTIEIAIPGSASDGLGHIASPNKQIIEEIEDQLKKYR